MTALMATASAAAPSPSPSLDTLAAAPVAAGYVDDNTTAIPIRGIFDLEEYVGFLAPSDPSTTATTLRRDGFVSGFARSWIDSRSKHLLLELVVAFSGGQGASRWLKESETADKANAHYSHPISMSGIGPYYGWHVADAAAPDYADVISFVKGNDFYLVGIDSPADDLGDATPKQTKVQYDVAPDYTIPPSQWREGSQPVLTSSKVGALLVAALTVAVILVVSILRRRRPI
jgi:hypothetical protein